MSGITPDTITPGKLRAAATVRNATWLPILASCGPMLADAIEIADSCARADIECECLGNHAEGYDLSTAEAGEMVGQSVRYLMARGLIEREGDVVRFRE